MEFSPKTMKLSLIFLIFLNLGYQSCDGLRILGIFPFNSRSHFIMSEKLLQNLARKGHQVDVYSQFPLKKPMPNYTDYSLTGKVPLLVNNMTYDDVLYYRQNFMLKINRFFEISGDPMCDLLDLPVFQNLIHNPPQDPPYDIIIAETLFSLCHAAWSRHLKVPMIDVWVNILPDWLYESRGVTVTPAVLPTSIYYHKDPDTFLNRLNNYAVNAITNLLFRYYSKNQDKIVEKHFGPGYPTVMELIKEPGLLFLNHHNSLHGVRTFSPSVVPVSGLHIEDQNETLPKDLQVWLDESKHGFVYFTFGSMVRIETFPEPMIKAMYEAFESIAPVRVLWKIISPEELPPNLPKNVRTGKWFQQQAILKHKNVKAFITHGGLMGTLESVYFGVPMIVIPLFADQFANAIMYEKKQIGITVHSEEIEAKFKNAVHDMLKNPIYQRSIERVSKEYRDSPMSPVETATYWVEYIARHGNNVLRSPEVDMPWWQIRQLDVFAFLSVVLIAILYISFKLLKTLLNLLTSKKCNRQVEKVKKN